MLFQAGKQESLRLDDRRKSDPVELALLLLLTVFDSARVCTVSYSSLRM